jgi:phosphatidylserine/phosphatidylglycerophosphate/cardiolipin synthase-like enzyme
VTSCSEPQDCTAAVVAAIGDATSEILVQAYSFSSASILRALAEGKQRGIDVRIILDRSNDTRRHTGATILAHEGIPILIDDAVTIAHNKVVIVDRKTVITGSFIHLQRAAQKR